MIWSGSSFRHGIRSKFSPPWLKKLSLPWILISSNVSTQSDAKPGQITKRFLTPFLGRFSSVKRLDLFVEVAIKAFNLKLINGVRIKATSHEKEVEEIVINKLKESKIPLKIYKDKKSADIYSFFKAGDIYLNMQSKCGVGKAMLEACAVGVEVIVACKELKYLISNIEKRTINNKDNINSAIKIIKDITKID